MNHVSRRTRSAIGGRRSLLVAGLAALGLIGLARPAVAQAPVIASFTRDGALTCTNLEPGSAASVEWAPSVTGPWTNTPPGAAALTADTDGVIRLSVPMTEAQAFFRVQGIGRSTNETPAGMSLIPAGLFEMGNCMDRAEGRAAERPVHLVRVSAFYMDKCEVTGELWNAVRSWQAGNGYAYDNSGQYKAATHPITSVSWYDAVKWCNARSQQEGLTPCYYTDAGLTQVYKMGQIAPYVKWNANGYRLPTEAEWEKAARGGVAGRRFPWSHTDLISHALANYSATSGCDYDAATEWGYDPRFEVGDPPFTSPVHSYQANSYGLHDMAGNVWEYCWDWYDSDWYSNPAATRDDTRGPSSGTHRVFRGGAWGGSNQHADGARCARRNPGSVAGAYHYSGFRCARGL